MGLFGSKRPNANSNLELKAPTDLMTALTSSPQLLIRQVRELAEIIINFETVNKYMIFAHDGAPCGQIIERGSGFLSVLKRLILRSHRPFVIDVFDAAGKSLLTFDRPFFWFFSDISVKNTGGEVLGSAHRKFGIINKIYELRDGHGQPFARINSSLFKIWTFAIRDANGNEVSRISKKWTGALKEVFTDADNFMIEFGSQTWTQSQRAVILASSISVDFDFFENNSSHVSNALPI
jgi:hypothetical protein